MQHPLIAFVHTEKTGGITLNRVLQNSYGPRHCDVQTIAVRQKEFQYRDFKLVKMAHPRLESIAGHKIRPYVELNCDVKYFTYLREPVKRCISHYQFQVHNMGQFHPFDYWIGEDHYRNYQTQKIAGVQDVGKAIEILEERFLFVGLTEKFDESLSLLNQLLRNRLDISYDRHNVSPDNAIRDGIMSDPGLMEMARDANELDRQLYDYVVNELYPRYQAQAAALPETGAHRAGASSLPLNRLYRNAIYKPLLTAARLVAGRRESAPLAGSA